jgi:hypothetical protein
MLNEPVHRFEKRRRAATFRWLTHAAADASRL